MTKKLQEFFNISGPPTEDDADDVVKDMKEQLATDALVISSNISTAEKVDLSLSRVTGLDDHDTEMDTIAKRAMDSYNDLVSMGQNVADVHAGKIFEVAGQMLKTALDAKNAKADKKLKMIELQIKKLRSEQIDHDLGISAKTSTGMEFDRNELLKHIIKVTKADESDK